MRLPPNYEGRPWKWIEDQLAGFMLLFSVAGLVVIPLLGIAILTIASFGCFD